MMEKDLTQLRSKIAEIDDEMLRLLVERFELTDEVGRIKKASDIPIENKEVEAKILSRLENMLGDSSSKASVINIYREIFMESKERQKKI
ncbi:MAG: chorismate mutase [Candidatus Woesearchaeota archaeon]